MQRSLYVVQVLSPLPRELLNLNHHTCCAASACGVCLIYVAWNNSNADACALSVLLRVQEHQPPLTMLWVCALLLLRVWLSITRLETAPLLLLSPRYCSWPACLPLSSC